MSLAVIALSTFIILSAGASIYGGIAEKSAADDQAALLEEQARIQQEETGAEASRKGEQRRKFIAQQKVSFLANGIGLAGTGLVVLQDTYDQFEQEISAIKRSGSAQAKLLDRQAPITKKSGKAKLISGVIGGGTSIAGGVFAGKATGVLK